MDTNEVLKRIKDANRSEIHRNTGISLSGVSRILSGARVPSAKNLKVMADELGVAMGDLYSCLLLLRTSRRSARRSRRRHSAA